MLHVCCNIAPAPKKTFPTASTRRGVVTTGGIESNPACKFNRFLAHQSANVGSIVAGTNGVQSSM